jgi:YesN/AraC family two-component response regulator
MPMMGGIELAKIIFEQYPATIVVFLSGYAEFTYAQQAMKYHVFEYLLKPVKFDNIVDVFNRIHALLDQSRNQKAEGASNELPYYESIVMRIHKFVEENLKTVTWKQVAQYIRLSPNYLSYLYKKQTGRNFQEYLQEIKMQRAKTYLLKTDMKTYEIADKLGYANAKNFTRAFHSYYHCSPRHFRQQGKAN